MRGNSLVGIIFNMILSIANYVLHIRYSEIISTQVLLIYKNSDELIQILFDVRGKQNLFH